MSSDEKKKVNLRDPLWLEVLNEDDLKSLMESGINIEGMDSLTEKKVNQTPFYKLLLMKGNGLDESAIERVVSRRDPGVIQNKTEIPFRIPTGSSNIDSLLENNGIHPGDLILFYGKSNSGKTQISHSIAAEALINIIENVSRKSEHEDLSKEVNFSIIYLDSENTFRPSRLYDIIRNRYKDISKEMGEWLFSLINVVSINNIDSFILSIKKIKEIVKKKSFTLIIIDSLTNYYAAEIARARYHRPVVINNEDNAEKEPSSYKTEVPPAEEVLVDKISEDVKDPNVYVQSGKRKKKSKGKKKKRRTKKKDDSGVNSEILRLQSRFMEILKTLADYASNYNCAIVCTSQVRSVLDDNLFFKIQPVAKTLLNRFIKQWILIGEYEDILPTLETRGLRFAHLINSQTKSEKIIKFKITKGGISDAFV